MVNTATALTLADLAKEMGPNGEVLDVAEILAESNPILEDMVFTEANGTTTNLSVARSGLPAGTWRKLNYGVQPEKATSVQITDSCGMLEAYAEVDKKIISLSKNPAKTRLSQDRAFIMGLGKTMASTLIYGDTDINPERFMGLMPRFDSLTAENGQNIINAGGTGVDSNNTSILLVGWGESTCHGFYPQGSKAGLDKQDLGEVTLIDAAGGKYQGLRTHYTWDMGLAVPDWRYIVRIANIDVSDLLAKNAAAADLVNLMIQAVELLPDENLGRPVFYCNRVVRSILRQQIQENIKQSTLSIDNIAGKRVMNFDGIPIRRTDAILNTEATIS